MRFTLFINQVKTIEWNLTVQQSILFSYLHDLPTWAQCDMFDGKAFWWSGRDKIISELPILTSKPDTIKKYMQALEDKGLIERHTYKNRAYVRVTERGKEWNSSEASDSPKGGMIIPTKGGAGSLLGGDLNPPNKNTNDHNTNDQSTNNNLTRKRDEFFSKLDFSSWPSIPELSILQEWKKLRTQKRAPITQHVINAFGKKMTIAQQELELSPTDVLEICLERGWQGFELSWIEKTAFERKQQTVGMNRQQALEARNQAVVDEWLEERSGRVIDHE
ncbi:hypothetical protein C4G95_RS20570 [Vibrio parahaemolyticus]|nr:hypothetical protein [Vibrio parahaemolyticus]